MYTIKIPTTMYSDILIYITQEIDGLVQDCSNSSALAMELLQSCTEPWKWRCLQTTAGTDSLH